MAASQVSASGAASAAVPLALPFFFAGAGDWAWVVMGSVAGSILAISIAEAAAWHRMLISFISNIVAGLVFARLAAPIIGKLMANEAGAPGGISSDHLLMAAAAIVAVLWPQLLARLKRKIEQ